MQTLTLKAPAKINLYLHVQEKRADGFHNIETIFEKVDLCDVLTLTKRKQGIRVWCSLKGLPEDKRNLSFKAAAVLLEAAHCRAGVQIRLTKRIPVAAGLGGGSSDAAGVLLGLNKLFSFGLSRDRLLKIAARLGADVPFFILPAAYAVGRGRGEILTPLKIKRKDWYVLVVPRGLAISTRGMYRQPRITLTKPPYSVKIALRAFKKGDLTSLDRYTYNSFESIVTNKYKEILLIKKALKSLGACAALMSGSGPCVFGITSGRKEAIDISRKVQAREKNWQVIVTKTYSRNTVKNRDSWEVASSE